MAPKIEPATALIIGAGPAGLMAAEALSQNGIKVILAEAKPSPARKFLMAGKSGLNLTKDEPLAAFLQPYQAPWLTPMLRDFDPAAVMSWAKGLGQEVFTGSSGRVFPRSMKGSPLLRAWLARLDSQGVELRRNWRWTGWEDSAYRFDTPNGVEIIAPQVCILAMGGASWARLGSDAAWVPFLQQKGVTIQPWAPANMGFNVAWSAHMERHFGYPIKGAHLWAGQTQSHGEFVISKNGLEGGAIYALSRALREGASLRIDLLPQLSTAALGEKVAKFKPTESLSNRLRKLGLSPAAIALAMETARQKLQQGDVSVLKSIEITLTGPRPLDEAISVAGGISADSLSPDLELKALPNTFAAGEMLDWEAPTGGYLLTACFATGLWAGRAALKRFQSQ